MGLRCWRLSRSSALLLALGCGARSDLGRSAAACGEQVCPAAPVGMHNTCKEESACVAVCDDGLSPCDGGCCSTTQLSLSPLLSCALKGDGSVWCWHVVRSERAMHTYWTSPPPDRVTFPGPSRAVTVGAGICTQQSDGIVCRPVTAVGDFQGVDIGDVLPWTPPGVSGHLTLIPANGGGLISAREDSGAVDTTLYWPKTEDWGRSPGPWQALAAGMGYACGLTPGVAVRCFGNDPLINGVRTEVLGGAFGAPPDQPVPIAGLSDTPVAISAAAFSACVLGARGGVQCWGDNEDGELGTGQSMFDLPASAKPLDVLSLGPGSHVIRISSGGGTTCAIKDDRSVWCWGLVAFCADKGARRPFPVPEFGKVSSVEEDSERICAVLLGGGVACFDFGSEYQIQHQTACIPGIEPYLVPGL